MGYAVLGILLNNIVFVTLKVSCHPVATLDLSFIANKCFFSVLLANIPFMIPASWQLQTMYCFSSEFITCLPPGLPLTATCCYLLSSAVISAATCCSLLPPSAIFCHLLSHATTCCHLLSPAVT